MKRAHCGIVRAGWWLAGHTGALIIGLAAVWMASAPRPAWGQSAWPTYPNNNAISVTSGGKVGVGTTLNNIYDGVGGARQLVVSGSDPSTTIGGSLASLTIVNSNTTARNSAQLNFATLNAPTSGIQHSPATISALFDMRSGDGTNKYPSADLVFATAPGYLMGNGGPTERLRISSTGNVGIGTITPTYRLTVEGAIGAREVIITNTPWSDYVFRPGYRLQPLSEVDAYIQAHHHLPDIPSEAEVQEKGVSLGDMQSKLLAKVEELTLHMIHAEERNNVLDRQNQELRGRIARLEHGAVSATATAAK